MLNTLGVDDHWSFICLETMRTNDMKTMRTNDMMTKTLKHTNDINDDDNDDDYDDDANWEADDVFVQYL